MPACPHCRTNREFRDAKNYVAHVKENHYAGESRRFQCFLCSLTFHRIQRFEVHVLNCFNKNAAASNFPRRSPLRNATQVNLPELNIEPLNLTQMDIPETYPIAPSQKTSSSSSNIFQQLALEFSLAFHSKPNMTRKDLFAIQKYITDNVLKKVSDLIDSKIQNCNCEVRSEIYEISTALRNLFSDVKTEYLLEKTLEKESLLVPPKEIVLNTEVEHRRAVFSVNKSTAHALPLSFQIYEFIRRNERVDEMLSNLEKYSKSTDTINHFVQGTVWKNMLENFPKDDNIVYLPLGIYTDDLQYNNPLGSHTDSVDNIYYYFPLLDDPFHKDNIHMYASIKANYVKSYGNGRCFQNLVNCLKELFDVGLEVVVKGKRIKVKFLLGLIIGDNLALNSILEYVMTFVAKYYCRICLLSKDEAELTCIEVISKLRTVENYNEGLALQDPKQSGIKGDCVFNQLEYFHCIFNKVLEIMHDFFEGIIKYVVCQCFVRLTEEKNITLVNEINKCIADLDYAVEEVQYIPRVLDIKHLKMNKLKMTARETWQFLYLLPICLGNRIERGV